jgi:hypothetical protein
VVADASSSPPHDVAASASTIIRTRNESHLRSLNDFINPLLFLVGFLLSLDVMPGGIDHPV